MAYDNHHVYQLLTISMLMMLQEATTNALEAQTIVCSGCIWVHQLPFGWLHLRTTHSLVTVNSNGCFLALYRIGVRSPWSQCWPFVLAKAHKHNSFLFRSFRIHQMRAEVWSFLKLCLYVDVLLLSHMKNAKDAHMPVSLYLRPDGWKL